MRVLLSAFACRPDMGSENETGLRAVLAAASAHEVWLFTHRHCEEPVRSVLAAEGLSDAVHVVAIGEPSDGTEQSGLLRFHRLYDRWQRDAGELGRRLDAEIGFDVVHHVGLASFWARAGVSAVDRPLVIGPSGGGTEAPWGLLGLLGVRGLAEFAVRSATRRVSLRRPAIRQQYQRAQVVLVQNEHTRSRLPRGTRAAIYPHSTAVVDGITSVPPGLRTKELVHVGRLRAWKGGVLALRALVQVSDPEATLVVLGEGPDRDRMARHAQRLGVADRVRFEGRVGRDEAMARVAHAGVLLHPALHDEAPLAVAEAMVLGTPVVGLAWGGLPSIHERWPEADAVLVRPSTPGRTARALAAAVDGFLAAPPPVPAAPRPPVESYAERILASYEEAVALFPSLPVR